MVSQKIASLLALSCLLGGAYAQATVTGAQLIERGLGQIRRLEKERLTEISSRDFVKSGVKSVKDDPKTPQNVKEEAEDILENLESPEIKKNYAADLSDSKVSDLKEAYLFCQKYLPTSVDPKSPNGEILKQYNDGLDELEATSSNSGTSQERETPVAQDETSSQESFSDEPSIEDAQEEVNTSKDSKKHKKDKKEKQIKTEKKDKKSKKKK